VTKSFVSTLVGIARDEGRISSLQDPIERYIPELAPTAWSGTTIQNILQMESGMEWDEGTADLKQNTQVRQWRDLWLDYVTNGRAGRDRNEFLVSLRRIAPQGTAFSYNSGNTQVLAWLVESVYRASFAQVMSEKLWKPAGMQADASIITDRHGRAIASQGLYGLPYDFARFGQLFLDGGRTPDGRQIVSEAWVAEATDLRNAASVAGGEYAYQWWANATDPRGFEASGFQGNKITVSPGSCTVAVRLAHSLGLVFTESGETEVELGGAEYDAMQGAVARALGGCTTA
jgi:CubicO group peptidase (beta-lactamase class C family)